MKRRKQALAKLVSNESPIFVRDKIGTRKVDSDKNLTRSVQLFQFILAAPREFILDSLESRTSATLIISFGQSPFTSKFISPELVEFLNIKNISHQREEFGDEYIGGTDEIVENSPLVLSGMSDSSKYIYSQSSSAERSESIISIEEPKMESSAKNDAKQTRSNPVKAQALLRQLQENPHPENPFYSSMTQRVANKWADHLCTNPSGTQALTLLLETTSFSSGKPDLPAHFTPDWDDAIWKAYFPCQPYKPIRGSFPLQVDGSYAPHPTSSSSQVQALPYGNRFLEALMGNSSSSASAGNHVENANTIYFKRDPDVEKLQPVTVVLDATISWHINQLKIIDPMVFSHLSTLPVSSSEELVFEVALSCGSSINYTLGRASTTKISDVMGNKDVAKPVIFEIKCREKLRSLSNNANCLNSF
jgi:hypothetical protein